MDIQKFSIAEFKRPLTIVKDAKSIGFSFNLDLIAVLSKGNEGLVIPIFQTNSQFRCGDFIWKSAKKLCSLKFSEDSEELATVTKDGEITIFGFRQGRKICPLTTKNLRQPNFLDIPGDRRSFEPQILRFTKHQVILVCRTGYILSLEWNENGIWVKDFAISTAKKFIDAKICDGQIYLLSELGTLDIFDVNTGVEKHLDIKIAQYLNEATGTVVERFFTKLAVSTQSIAVTDLNHQIYIIDLQDLVAKVTLESRIATQVQTLSASAGQVSSNQRFQFKGSESYPLKIQHQSFPDRKSLNLSSSFHSSSLEDAIELPLEYTQVTALEGCCVQDLNFCSAGLTVWYTQQDDGGLFRLYNLNTGACLDEEFLSDHTKALLSGFMGCADAFISPGKIRLHSCDVSKRNLATMIIQRVGVLGMMSVLQGEGWKDIHVALPVISEGLNNRQIDSIKFSLNIHNHGFFKSVSSLTKSSNVEDLIGNLDQIFQSLLTSVEDNVSSLDYAEHLVTLSLNHFYDLLGSIYKIIDSKPENSTPLLQLEQKILKSITTFRSYLYHTPKFAAKVESDSDLPKELQGISQPMKDLWKSWFVMSETEIVKHSIEKNCIPMAHTYFVVAKRALQKNVDRQFEAIANDWILELLRLGELTQAQKVMTNLGKIPLDEMKSIYLRTLEEKLQDFLFGHLSNQNMLTEDERHAGLFLRQVKHALHKNFKPSELTKTDYLRLTVGYITSQPILWRDTIWAELAFAFQVSELMMQVEPVAAWNYLLIINRPDLLKIWIDLRLKSSSAADISRQIRLILNCEEEFADKVLYIFKIWDISTEMVERVTTADCLKSTKDAVLDHFSRQGIFCSVDKASISSILIRFVRTKNLPNVKSALESPTAVICWNDFSKMLLKFCAKHKLAPVLFSLLADNENLQEMVEQCEVSESAQVWLRAWFSLVQFSKDPSTDHFLDAIKSNVSLLADDQVEAYLEQQPFIVLALILLENKENFNQILAEDAFDGLKKPLNQKLIESVKRSFPVFEMILTEEAWDKSQKPDVSMYEMLERGSVFDVPKLFGWQENHKNSIDETTLKMPNFSKGSLYEKYANNQFINYEYYLKQGRPSYAYCSFIVDELKLFKKLSKKRIKQACNVAHGIALSRFSNQSIVAACVSFIEMLGLKSEKSRLHISTGLLILKNIPSPATKDSISELLNSLLSNREEAAPKLLAILEQSLIPNDLNQINTFLPIQNWAVAVRLSKVHSLPMPESLLKFYCENDMWLHFVICLELYQYTTEQAFHLVEFVRSKSMKDHLKHSFLRTSQNPTKKLSSPFKSRDTRKSLYSRIGLTEKVVKCSPTTDGSPDGASLLAISWSSESSLQNELTASSFTSHLMEGDLFRCILGCHSSIDPSRAMLEACLAHNNPFLAVLASCYENCSFVDCLGTWIVSSVSRSAREKIEKEIGGNLFIWNEMNIPTLWLIALRTHHIATVSISLDVFLPECPLRTLLRFIKNGAVDKSFDEATDLIQTFKSQCQSLPVAVTSDGTKAFLMQRTWIYKTAVQIVCTALANTFSSSFHQFKFLQVLCKSAFSEYITVECPDFTHLLQLQECLLETGVTLDYTALCVSRRGSDSELEACLQRLVEGGFFKQALEMARIAGLPRESVVIAQWTRVINALGDTEGNESFWKECQVAFVESKIQPLVAAEFFHEHAETRTSVLEKYQVLQLAHSWYSLSKQMSVRKRQDCYITKAIEVKLEMWRTRLKIGKNCDIDAPLTPKLFTQTRKELFSEAGIGYIDFETKLENDNEAKALDEVIGELLDQGRVASAMRLEALFCHKNRDLRLLVTCLSLAESEIMPYQLSSEQRLLMEQSYTPSSSFRKRPLYSLKISSLASNSLNSPGHSTSLSSDFVELPPKEQQEALAAIEKLSDRLLHGKIIGERIAACFRVAMNMDKSYIDIITMENPLSVLKAAISKDCLSKFAVASDLSLAGQISKEDMTAFLRDEILAAVSKNQVQGGLFWGYDLDSSFHLVLELCQDPVLLGLNLLELTRPLHLSATPDNIKKVHGVIVELLIRSHDCYTAACDMEGIAEVLLRARALTSNLLQQQEWQLMVRLVTGIGRYNEMAYIFKILKDHEQFEYLLGKGMDKVPGLKIALLEFVRSKCAENRDLLQLVALHFRLYSEVAEIWEAEAKNTIGRLLSITVIELGIAISATKYKPKPKQPTPEVLKASTDLGHQLKLAMQNYTHAAECYLQANKLTKAMDSASQAELIALQISLTIGVPNGQTLDCLLGQEQAQVSILITNRLSFPQAIIVAKAYNHPVDWGAALYHHCVLQNEQKYLTDFKQGMNLTPALVEDISRRFQHESSLNSDMAKMMKQIVNNVKSVEVKYRVASQLGFKDILENMLSSADLPYLKDTVWRRGMKHY
ncbi:spatacsin [Neocloeon triangulifer]|uniref:spatacsin n=1 Tax=Neocloeon triangulifer TaxID=2078957 RepID=UPI00286F1DE2|nr:spatacsin [Neocloeon triangulifer]XP_059487740.1 spatacsin [Neocloeon triangulifer]